MCDSTMNLLCFGDCSPWAPPATRHITEQSVAGVPHKVKHAFPFRARRLPGEMSASGRDAPEEPLPLHLLMQIAHFRASRLSAQMGFPSGAFSLTYTLCDSSHISRPGASLGRFRHLASLPQRSLFPYPFLRRSPNPGQALPCLDFVIWPGFPTGVCSLRHSVTDRSFPGQAPVWPDFGIWPAFPRGP